ncbi:Atu4866 domain-containing protein [Actinoplanes sp. NPDC049316]|uniref:Atu4866 domain-containing protein n=1 Tax=Actinoplanes sp. NPDC049316 TaxID=3154727 RepID=UPI00343BEAEB
MISSRIDSAALARASGPLLFVNATIHTLDPAIADLEGADLLLAGDRIAGVGVGLRTAAGDDGATVVDCTGLSVVPIAGLSTLAPGSPATFAVIDADGRNAWEYVIWRPEHAVLVVVDGKPRGTGSPTTVPDLAQVPAGGPYIGMWVDESGFLHQELAADGRYDETRGGRPHAYQGSFWIDGDRIVYLDDLGFWAYGEFLGGVLHHAGYVLHRVPGERS